MTGGKTILGKSETGCSDQRIDKLVGSTATVEKHLVFGNVWARSVNRKLVSYQSAKEYEFIYLIRHN